MNSSNQKLLKGIRIFFKAAYIVLIVIFCFSLLSNIMLFFLDEGGIGTVTVIHVLKNPSITFEIAGVERQPILMLGMGAAILEGVPIWLKINNALLVFVSIFLFIMIIRTIRKIIGSIEGNEVFSLKNAKRLKYIGLYLLGNLVLSTGILVSSSIYLKSFDPSSISAFIGFIFGDSLGYIIAIVFTFFMAAAFKLGVGLQEENKSFV